MSGPTQGPSAMVRGSHAVVVGGGIGGLLAGVVLRRRFERVTVLERDRWPELPGPRRGAPQGRCLHVLAARGLRVIERLIPGWTAALVRAGAVPFDVGAQARVRLSTGWLPRESAGITTVACSRGLLEQELRRRAERIPGLVLVPGHAVRGLLGDATRVVGVRMEGEGRAWDEPAELTVVAAGGRSALGGWWSALGLPPLEHAVVPTHHRYVSRWFEGPPASEGDWKLLSITPAPGVPGGGVLLEAEGRRWGLALLVPGHRTVPSTDEELLRACAELADPALYEALRAARPITPIVRHERTDNRLLLPPHARTWPEGVAIVGDAACMLDPYFGLGMTACALGVEALAELDPSAPHCAHAFQRRLAECCEAPWRVVTEGEPHDPAVAYYRKTVLQMAPHSAPIARVLLRRMHLLDDPDVLERAETVRMVRETLARPSLTSARSTPSRA